MDPMVTANPLFFKNLRASRFLSRICGRTLGPNSHNSNDLKNLAKKFFFFHLDSLVGGLTLSPRMARIASHESRRLP